MSLTIDATVGGASANAFITEAEAIAYMASRLNVTGWTTLSGATCTETEKAAIIEATREISARDFRGQRATSTQALSWPRWWVVNPDAPVFGYVYYSNTVIPDRVKDATCELALQFLKLGTTDAAALDSYHNVQRKNIGGAIDTEYTAIGDRAIGLARYPRVLLRLDPLLAPNTTQVIRG